MASTRISQRATVPILPLQASAASIGEAIAGSLAHKDSFPLAAQIAKAARISMLHPDVLQALALLAMNSKGPLLEIGPYIGGSTVILALANREKKWPFISIELGGSYPTHPSLPSSDILSDLRRNLDSFGVADEVELITKYSRSASTVARVAAAVGQNKLGLVFIDADGELRDTMPLYSKFMRDDCLLVFDDYETEHAPEKAASVKPYVDGLVSDAIFRCFIKLPGTTWVGQLNGPEALVRFRSIPRRQRFIPEQGFCFVAELESNIPPDIPSHPNRSSLRLYEDDVLLGPAHSIHSDIRTLGKGRFSHWGIAELPDDVGNWRSTIYFSTSDSSNPMTSGRKYSVQVGDEIIDLWTEFVHAAP